MSGWESLVFAYRSLDARLMQVCTYCEYEAGIETGCWDDSYEARWLGTHYMAIYVR